MLTNLGIALLKSANFDRTCAGRVELAMRSLGEVIWNDFGASIQGGPCGGTDISSMLRLSPPPPSALGVFLEHTIELETASAQHVAFGRILKSRRNEPVTC